MGLNNVTRTAVATTLAETLDWGHVHVADDFGEPGPNRFDKLQARMSSALSAGRSVVYSCPSLSPTEWRQLRDSLRHVELVRLQGAGEEQTPLAMALTLDGQMSAPVLAATVRAVLRLEKAR
jgi:gluconate kinase